MAILDGELELADGTTSITTATTTKFNTVDLGASKNIGASGFEVVCVASVSSGGAADTVQFVLKTGDSVDTSGNLTGTTYVVADSGAIDTSKDIYAVLKPNGVAEGRYVQLEVVTASTGTWAASVTPKAYLGAEGSARQDANAIR